MADREFHACAQHLRKAFRALEDGDGEPDFQGPLPGDRIITDSKTGCAWCRRD